MGLNQPCFSLSRTHREQLCEQIRLPYCDDSRCNHRSSRSCPLHVCLVPHVSMFKVLPSPCLPPASPTSSSPSGFAQVGNDAISQMSLSFPIHNLPLWFFLCYFQKQIKKSFFSPRMLTLDSTFDINATVFLRPMAPFSSLHNVVVRSVQFSSLAFSLFI